jgi:hypothetical protein
MEFYINKTYDIKYINSEKSNWFNLDTIKELLEVRNQKEKEYSSLILNKKPVHISKILPVRVLNHIVSKTEFLKFFSPISLKLRVFT